MDERRKCFSINPSFLYLRYTPSCISLLVSYLLFEDDLKKKDPLVGCISPMLNFEALLVTFTRDGEEES